MRILLAGATGAIGRPLLPMLLAAGHEVYATTRSAERATELERAGAKPEIVNFLDPVAVAELVDRIQPEVVIDQLTSLPQKFDPRKAKAAYAANDKIRREGTGALIAAAKACDSVQRYVVQSVAFLYAPGGNQPKHEDDPAWTDGPAPFDASVGVLVENERKVVSSPSFTGVALRYGFLYGPGTWFASDGSTADAVRRRQYPLIGNGAGVNSLVHVTDAATATMAALKKGTGIYNVVDDEPVPMNELVPFYASLLGAKPPRRVPVWLARLVVGRYLATAATTLSGASNEKIRSELGWQPAIPTWRDGLRDYRDSDPPR